MVLQLDMPGGTLLTPVPYRKKTSGKPLLENLNRFSRGFPLPELKNGL
jgi:hypothetical protein